VSPDLLSVVVRTLGFVGLFQAAGAAFFMALFAGWIPRSGEAIRRLALCSALAGLILLGLHQALEGARMADGFSGLIDARMQTLAWTGSGGNAALIEMIGLGVLAFAMTRKGPPAAEIATTGALIAACAMVLTGHTRVHSQRALLGILLAVHLLLVAFWFGALMPLMICGRRESRAMEIAVLQGFSAVAGPLVPCIAVAGLAMALILMPDRASWSSRYGVLVLAKLGAFAVLMLLAAWNRWRALPALSATDSAAAGQSLRRVIAIEYVLIVAVLAMTAVLTTFYSP
jgi:putative copper export protein